MSVQKPVGATATFTAVVTNAAGIVLPDAVVVFTDDVADAVTAEAANPQIATLVGTAVEIVTVTATAQGANGPITGSDSADFVDNVPAAVTVTAS